MEQQASRTLKQCRPLLGTFVEIRVIHSQASSNISQNAINAAFTSIETVQKLMNFHDANSELSAINRHAMHRATRVHPWVYAVLKRAAQIHLCSQGLFDCTVADTLVSWHYLPSPNNNPYRASTCKATQADVVLLPDYHVFYKQPLWLDLGGIAKGFAVDMAIHTLRQHGITHACINAGGDLRLIGSTPETIAIKHPANPDQRVILGELQNGACATSATYYSSKSILQPNNSRITVNALVNPINRSCITQPYSYSVIAANATVADSLTKVVALSGDTHHPCIKAFGAKAYILK